MNEEEIKLDFVAGKSVMVSASFKISRREQEYGWAKMFEHYRETVNLRIGEQLMKLMQLVPEGKVMMVSAAQLHKSTDFVSDNYTLYTTVLKATMKQEQHKDASLLPAAT